MNGAYQIINFDDIEFTTGTAELVVGAYKKITDTAKRFVITHLNLDDEVYKDIQLTFENVDGTFVGTGVVNGKYFSVSITSGDNVTIVVVDAIGQLNYLQNLIKVVRFTAKDVDFDTNIQDTAATITSGDIGTRACHIKYIFNEPGYKAIMACVIDVTRSSDYFADLLLQPNDKYVWINLYRASTNAVANASTTFDIVFLKEVTQ